MGLTNREVFKVKHLGQIAEGEVSFGDVTILTGPQASGKSIFLQTFKLVKDTDIIFRDVIYPEYEEELFLPTNLALFKASQELFFGEGFTGAIKSNTEINYNETDITGLQFRGLQQKTRNRYPFVLYIPAHRSLVLQNGYPKRYSEYEDGPYVLKKFSDYLYRLLSSYLYLSHDGNILENLHANYMFGKQALYSDATLHVGRQLRTRKKLLLNVAKQQLQPLSWSTGQREFTPLILGLDLLEFGKDASFQRFKTETRNQLPIRLLMNRIWTEKIEYVIIEEPEMGLHSEAIVSVMLLMLELASRGYKVIISTHSPIPLEAIWAIQLIQQREKHTPELEIAKLFLDEEPDAQMLELLKKIAQMDFGTYYFDNKGKKGTVVQDISSLDPFSENTYEAHLGGLTTFGSRASHIVAGLPFPEED